MISPAFARARARRSRPGYDLSVDDAVSLFFTHMPMDLPELEPVAPRTPAEDEAARFHAAERVLRALCPAPAACGQGRCRRARRCQHLDDLQMQRLRPPSATARRPPGALAVRHAIWLYCRALLQDDADEGHGHN